MKFDTPATTNPIDHDGFGLGAGFGVEEHHAALVGGEAGVAPGGQDDDDRPKRTAEIGEDVLVARWVGLILAPFEQAWQELAFHELDRHPPAHDGDAHRGHHAAVARPHRRAR